MKMNYKGRTHIRNIYIVTILLVAMSSILIYPVIGGNNQFLDNNSINKSVNYSIAIDQYHGFYRVYQINTSGRLVPVTYNGTLNISNGDTITWINDALPDAKFTVMSQQKLWNNYTGMLKWAYKRFSYTFNKSGTYDIYVKEYPRFKQKIVVGPIETSSTNATKATNMNSTSKKSTNTIKTNSTNDSKSLKMANSTSKSSEMANSTNISKPILVPKSLKATNSTNLTNISGNIPEKGDIGPMEYLIILLTMTTISMVYISKRKETKVILQNALRVIIYKMKG